MYCWFYILNYLVYARCMFIYRWGLAAESIFARSIRENLELCHNVECHTQELAK